MVGSKNKFGFVLSWADEVEKEEEAAQAQVHQKQKLNPFGSARPREVVLQEKGIDWRKLDHDLQQPSRISYGQKPLKENIPAPAVLAINKKQQSFPSRGREQKLENTKTGFDRSKGPRVLLPPQNHIPEVFVPPLRYPPKNVVAHLFEETCGSYNPYRLDVGQRNFQYENHIEPEEENTFNELGSKRFHGCKSLGHSSQSHGYDGYIDQNKFHIEWEGKHAVFENSRSFNVEVLRSRSTEALHNGRNLRKSVAHEVRGNADSDHRRNKFFEQNLVGFGSPEVNERRGAFLIHKKRWASDDESDWKNIQDDYARDVVRGCLMNPPSMQTIQNGWRRGSHFDSEKQKTGFQGNYNSRMVRFGTEEKVNWKKMESDQCEWQRIAGKFVGPSVEAVGEGQRAEASHNMKMKRADSGGNYRKRRMKSGSDNNHYHQNR